MRQSKEDESWWCIWDQMFQTKYLILVLAYCRRWLNCNKSGEHSTPLLSLHLSPLPWSSPLKNQLEGLASTVSYPEWDLGQSPSHKCILVYHELENRTWRQHSVYKRSKNNSCISNCQNGVPTFKKNSGTSFQCIPAQFKHRLQPS